MTVADRKLIDRERLCYGTAMRKASRRLTQLYDDALEGSGLRSTQYAILAELDAWSKDPPTIALLAEAMVMDRSALGHNLRPLVRDGLVALLKGQDDRRRRHIVLTFQGKARYREAKKLWEAAQARFETVYGAEASLGLRLALQSIAFNARLGSLKD